MSASEEIMKTVDQKTIGFGIVGTGAIAGFHARAIAAVPGAVFRAACSRTPEGAARFCAEHGGDPAGTLDDLLSRADIDAVSITVPSGTPGEVALRALECGKHVLCEKPLEVSTARIDRMIAAASGADRILAGVFQSRLGEDAQRLKSFVDDGRFGRLASCSAYVKWWRDPAYYSKSSWKGTRAQDGGGALMNQAIHAVDLLQWLVGMPVRVSARIATRVHPIEVEDTAVAWLEFANGALGVIEAATSCNPGADMRIEIAGEKGTAILENGRLRCHGISDTHPQPSSVHARNAGTGASDPKAIGIAGHCALIEDLVRAIRGGEQPSISATEARRAVQLIEALYESHDTARVVELHGR